MPDEVVDEVYDTSQRCQADRQPYSPEQKVAQWKNVGWWRLILNEFSDEPAAPVCFSQLEKDFLPDVFQKAILLLHDKKSRPNKGTA